MVDIRSAIENATGRLETAGIPESRREARSLLQHILRRATAFVIAHPEYELSIDELRAFWEAIARRERREPFQLIVGHQEFFGLEFEVEAGVLIPRPETEILVEKAIEILSGMCCPRIFELGVGTGCISVSILAELADSAAVGVDISDQALALALRNAEKHRVASRLLLRKADLFQGALGRYDMIVSNPPYVPDGDADSLQKEVISYDPPDALFSGSDGLDAIRRIVAGAPNYLNPNGNLIIEFGYGQVESVKGLLNTGLWLNIEVLDDLQGIPRTLVARLAR